MSAGAAVAEESPAAVERDNGPVWRRVLWLVLLLYAFLLGVHGLGEGFKLLGSGALDSFFHATSNPFVGLMVGILATSIVQSSSVTTSLIVGLVAAPENALPLGNAIPMVMGANFGTTVTNTLFALAHVRHKDEFRRAFSVSTCDDFFEILCVLVILPLEIATGFLQKTATYLAESFTSVDGMEYESPLDVALEGGLAPLESLLLMLTESGGIRGIVLIGLSGVVIFGALVTLVKVLRTTMASKVESSISGALGQHPYMAMLIGLIATVAVQSSSITTSLLVPLAGAGIITLQQAFPIVLGANVGTTVTALLAALAATGPNADAGIAVAMVHSLYNLTGILIFFPVPAMRAIPLGIADWIGGVAVESTPKAILYVVLIFYGLPALVAGVYQILGG